MSKQTFKVDLNVVGNPGLTVAVFIEASSESGAKTAAKAIFQEKNPIIVGNAVAAECCR